MGISQVVIEAVESMKKSFGGVEIKILDKEMSRTPPSQYAKIGHLGINISMYITGVRHHKLFLTYQTCEDILMYGPHIADSIIAKVFHPDFERVERKMKLDKINKIGTVNKNI